MGNLRAGRGVEHGVGARVGTGDVAEGAIDTGGVGSTSFEDFFEHAWPGAVRLAALLTQDGAAAEELAQDAFTQLYRVWGRPTNPEAYLRTTLVNRCHNWRGGRGCGRPSSR